MAQEWFVAGITTETDDDGSTTIEVPMYLDAIAGIDSRSGRINDFSEDKWSDLPWHPDRMYVVRVYGTQAALDDLAGRDSAWGKEHEGISDSEAASYLNDRHGVDRTWDEWQNHYAVG